MIFLTLPLPSASKEPEGSFKTCETVAFRIFVATRNAARCEHISAPMYMTTVSAANSTASQPFAISADVSGEAGSAPITPRTMLRMQRKGASERSALIPESRSAA